MACPSRRVWFALVLALVGCGVASPLPRPSIPAAPSEQAKCQIAASQQNPLVTEWPASEKANLEVRLREGGVVVSYSGCNMRLLPQCQVKGSYAWHRTTPASDLVEITNEDELYAKLPLGATSLEGELKRSGRLAVQTTVSGQLRLTGLAPAEVPVDGACAGATHVVAALSVGAFKLKAGGGIEAKADLGVMKVETGAKAKRGEETVRQAGDGDKCGESTDDKPSPSCASPVQLFLWPLPQAADVGPPGTVKVEFIAAESGLSWHVLSDEQVLCTTPCTQFVHPAQPLAMRERDAGFFSHNKVKVPPLRLHLAEAPLLVQAHPWSRGKMAGGATMGAFGGMALMSGIVFIALGCSGDRDGLCTAGLIAGPLGAAALAAGLYMALNANARAEVGPAGGGASGGSGTGSGMTTARW